MDKQLQQLEVILSGGAGLMMCVWKQREAGEDCCVLKHIFGGWNGYLHINGLREFQAIAPRHIAPRHGALVRGVLVRGMEIWSKACLVRGMGRFGPRLRVEMVDRIGSE